MFQYGIIFVLSALMGTWIFSTNSSAKETPQARSNTPKQPTELGDIHWVRDIDEGVARSKKEKKPMLVLFQEVPG